MTASTLLEAPLASYRVPGVYSAPQPRLRDAPTARTDVAGFIGFEPRVRDSNPPSQLLGGPPPVGHAFFVDVNTFQLRAWGLKATVPATPRLLLSQEDTSVPVLNGQSIVYSVAAGVRLGTTSLIVTPGSAAVTGAELAPSDDAIAAAAKNFFQDAGDTDPNVAASRRWLRIADVTVTRVGNAIRLTVLPALRIARCDDWNDFLARFGEPRDDGTLLGKAVHAFFSNGGSRCYVTTVRRPDFNDPEAVGQAGRDMVGVQGSSLEGATGLERLLLVDEVSMVDAPDLYSRGAAPSVRTVQLPPPAQVACFRPCTQMLPAPVIQEAASSGGDGDPLFPADLTASDPWADPFLGLQLGMISRCIPERWRVLLLLSPPLVFDNGGYGPPTAPFAQKWRDIFDAQQKTAGLGDSNQVSCVALYYPWVLIQEVAGDSVYPLPPTPLAAGVIARRDLARGPEIAPANETLSTVVSVTPSVDDLINAELYSPDPDASGVSVPAVNLIRSFAGYGIQAWGARTLSTDPWLRFLNVRRALSAIERRCKTVLDTLVFEPNTPLLWLQVTQSVLGILVPMFEAGGLRGDLPAQAFYVRCDSSVNPSDSIAEGRLVCEVGVAIAAPGEFIVFRVGRKEGIVEVLE